MTNREAGINVVREMMGDQAAAELSQRRLIVQPEAMVS